MSLITVVGFGPTGSSTLLCVFVSTVAVGEDIVVAAPCHTPGVLNLFGPRTA